MTLSRLSLLAALTLVSSGTLAAQTVGSLWFLQAGGGVGAHDNGPFSRRLQSYTPRQANGERLVYQTEEFSNVGYSVGASAGAMIESGWLFGASGELVMFPTVAAITGLGSERDEYVLGAWEGGLDVGYTILNADATIVYPFLHVGYASYSLEYTNRQSDSIPFFEGEPVAPRQTGRYDGGAARAGVGIGLNSFVGGGGVGGFQVGARISYGRMLASPEWEQDGAIVNNGGHTPCYNALTFSVAIGFGGGSAR